MLYGGIKWADIDSGNGLLLEAPVHYLNQYWLTLFPLYTIKFPGPYLMQVVEIHLKCGPSEWVNKFNGFFRTAVVGTSLSFINEIMVADDLASATAPTLMTYNL